MSYDYSRTRRVVVLVSFVVAVIFLRDVCVLLVSMSFPGQEEVFNPFANGLAMVLSASMVYFMLFKQGTLWHGNWWRKHLPRKEFWQRFHLTRRIHP